MNYDDKPMCFLEKMALIMVAVSVVFMFVIGIGTLFYIWLEGI